MNSSPGYFRKKKSEHNAKKKDLYCLFEKQVVGFTSSVIFFLAQAKNVFESSNQACSQEAGRRDCPLVKFFPLKKFWGKNDY